MSRKMADKNFKSECIKNRKKGRKSIDLVRFQLADIRPQKEKQRWGGRVTGGG